MSSALTPEHRAAARFAAAALADVVIMPGSAVKSVNEIIREYDARLTRFAYEVLNGTSDAVDFRRAHKALIRNVAPAAYKEGVSEGGGDPEDLDAEDAQITAQFIDDQSGFVNDFAKWLVGTNEAGKRNWPEKRAELATRIDYWVQALRALAMQAFGKAQGDPMCEWRVGDTEHCETCLELDGSKHKLSWYVKRNYRPRTPGADMDCGGYNCQCGLFAVKGGKRIL